MILYLTTTLDLLEVDLDVMPLCFYFQPDDGRSPPVLHYRVTPEVYAWACRTMATAARAIDSGRLSPVQWRTLAVRFWDVYRWVETNLPAAWVWTMCQKPDPKLPEPSIDSTTLRRGLDAIDRIEERMRVASQEVPEAETTEDI